MKYLLLSFAFCLVGCSTVQQAKKENSNCDIPELTGVSCVKPDNEKIAKYPLGSKDNPVRADGPAGQRKYLSKLICTNGEAVSAFSRAGSVGLSPYGFMMDLYIVVCDTDKGAIELPVHMDMYHEGFEETKVAEGFSSLSK